MGALRVLIVVRRTDDIASVLATFDRAGIKPHWERVDTREQVIDALGREAWSLVVYDPSMRELALETALLSARSIPLVERAFLARTLMVPPAD